MDIALFIKQKTTAMLTADDYSSRDADVVAEHIVSRYKRNEFNRAADFLAEAKLFAARHYQRQKQ